MAAVTLFRGGFLYYHLFALLLGTAVAGLATVLAQLLSGLLCGLYGVGALLSSKKLKAKMGSAMTDGMLMPYNKVLEEARKNVEK